MNIRREIIAFAIRLLADKSDVIAKPDPMSQTINALFGIESYDKTLARGIDSDIDKVTGLVKKKIVDHKFKKLTQNF